MALLCKTALACDFKSTSLKKKEIQITAAKWTTMACLRGKTSVLLSRVSLKLYLYFKGSQMLCMLLVNLALCLESILGFFVLE